VEHCHLNREAFDDKLRGRLRVAILIPAYQASSTIAAVISEVRAADPDRTCPLHVVDDGSTDRTADCAAEAGAHVLRHAKNLGKGAALMTGLRALAREGFEAAVTMDADLQHPGVEAIRLAQSAADQASLVLGVRDLRAAGAPASSQFSNAVSNYFLSHFAGSKLEDTQCGLRRYPLPQTLALDLRSPGYAFEAEVILRAARAQWHIEQIPIHVLYPPKAQRISHFHVVRDPVRIIGRVLQTWLDGVRG